jgi:hypothetical protein
MAITDARPVLLGMNNPLSVRLEHALYPHPPGCTGWRIWKMLEEVTGATRLEYVRAFDRVNLVTGAWSAEAAVLAGEALRARWRGRVVVVLGDQPRRALGLPRLFLHPQTTLDGVTWRQIPHPSGRNHFYNDAGARALVGQMLAELYRGGVAFASTEAQTI